MQVLNSTLDDTPASHMSISDIPCEGGSLNKADDPLRVVALAVEGRRVTGGGGGGGIKAMEGCRLGRTARDGLLEKEEAAAEEEDEGIVLAEERVDRRVTGAAPAEEAVEILWRRRGGAANADAAVVTGFKNVLSRVVGALLLAIVEDDEEDVEEEDMPNADDRIPLDEATVCRRYESTWAATVVGLVLPA